VVEEYPHFSDFAEEEPLEGNKMKLEDLLNKEVLVIGFKIKDSIQKKNTLYVTIQFRLGDETFITFTGSQVIMDQLGKYKEHLPFYATVKKINRYYTFV
jgi:hypothetical protein